MIRPFPLPAFLRWSILAAAILVAAPACDPPAAQSHANPEPSSGRTASLPTHEAFTRVLEDVVHVPRVDYALLQDRRELLDAYLAELARVSPDALAAEGRDERLAFWINAYNACMLKLVVDHYPIEPGGTGILGAIRNRVAGYPDNSVWQIPDVFSREHCRVAGQNRSQDQIEHEIIRPRFPEPRIHFAVNCAAVSCPVLRAEAYVPHRLDEQLDAAVRGLMDNPDHFRLEPGPPGTLRLNKVMDWYGEDFGGEEGLKGLFAGYLPEEESAVVLRADTRVRFFDYDWTLNDVPR